VYSCVRDRRKERDTERDRHHDGVSQRNRIIIIIKICSRTGCYHGREMIIAFVLKGSGSGGGGGGGGGYRRGRIKYHRRIKILYISGRRSHRHNLKTEITIMFYLSP